MRCLLQIVVLTIVDFRSIGLIIIVSNITVTKLAVRPLIIMCHTSPQSSTLRIVVYFVLATIVMLFGHNVFQINFLAVHWEIKYNPKIYIMYKIV